MFIPSDKRDTSKKWNEYSLIVPAVSVGNVGQLTADLIISTLFMERIGYIFHDSILPLIGNDPFAHPDSNTCKLVTNCEVYESLEHNLIVIQQRAPFVTGKQRQFKKWLSNWIKEKNFVKVIVLTSSSSEERLDKQLQGDQFRFLASPTLEQSPLGNVLRTSPLSWQELERRHTFPAPTPEEIASGTKEATQIYLPGGGMAKSLFEECYNDVPIIVLLLFCSEGDNVHDALKLADRLNAWTDLVDMKPKKREDGSIIQPLPSWKIPFSWRHFYGTRLDQTLFH